MNTLDLYTRSLKQSTDGTSYSSASARVPRLLVTCTGLLLPERERKRKEGECLSADGKGDEIYSMGVLG